MYLFLTSSDVELLDLNFCSATGTGPGDEQQDKRTLIFFTSGYV